VFAKTNMNMNRGATDRKDGQVAIVTGGNRKVFAKTNHCCETPARGKPHDLRQNSHAKFARSRPQSVLSCDSPCRNPTDGRSEDSVLQL
jgi:hypothetical protein